MTVLIQKLRQTPALGGIGFAWPMPANGFTNRAIAVGLLLALALVTPDGMALTQGALSEAYTAVAVFVAATMTVVMLGERALGGDLGALLRQHRHWQVPAGALLGTLPGCGGAIVAVTQFTRGAMSFGGMVATLTTTMGDAMFLLLARDPQAAVTVMVVSLAVGLVTGYSVDAIHGQRFMHSDMAPSETAPVQYARRPMSWIERIWVGLMIPGLAIGILSAFQVNVDAYGPAGELGLIGALLALAMWLWRGGESRACANGECQLQSRASSVVNDTNFVTAWVIFAFVGYELVMAITGADLDGMLAVWAPLVPLMAIAAGFIPGCGPQIVVTSMYLNGSIPFSAELGNAISNDGDALFPAIAVAPKAAMLATLYSAIPAVLVAYGWYALFE